MAYSKMQTDWISQRVNFIAPIYLYPGEDEMKALAYGALRVLRKEEPIRTYDLAPVGYASVQTFYEKYGIDPVE
jgi:butyrate kinase